MPVFEVEVAGFRRQEAFRVEAPNKEAAKKAAKREAVRCGRFFASLRLVCVHVARVQP